MRRLNWVALLMFALTSLGLSQVLTARPPASDSTPAAAPSPSIPLIVPAGTPLKVALDQEVRLRKVGQPLQAKVVEPVYAFDKLVVPSGTEVAGKVSAIEGVSKKTRTLAAMNADFSPVRRVEVEFDELRLADGRRLPIKTEVFPGSQGVLQFVTASDKDKNGKIKAGQNVASRKVRELRSQVRREWDTARKQIHDPGKMHRLERYAVARLPYHPQYMDTGTSFNADLEQPLDFGTEPLTPSALSEIGTPPPSGSIVHALLTTPLNSATAKKDDPVEAVISQPLVVSDHLILPEGSHLQGSVLQARPARRLARNGQLRIVFHQVVPPSGVEEKVQASLEAVAVAQGEHLSLDSEGGAQVNSPRTRYLTTAISVALAASSLSDSDHGVHRGTASGGGGDMGAGAANGAVGLGFLGTIVGAAAHSRIVSSGFGIYGASMSFYAHFLARGRDVVYPKDMSMIVGLGTRAAPPAVPAKAASAASAPAKPM